MLKNNNDSFLKKNYPLILIVVGFFLIFFPFDMIGASDLGPISFSLYGLSVVLIVGFVLFYKKRNEYSAKTRKIVKIAAFAVPLFFVAAIIFGAALGIGSALYKSSLESTENLDRELFEQKIVDWVNTHRDLNGVDKVNLDTTLKNLAEIRSADLTVGYPVYIEALSDIDINEIAKREGIECIIDGASYPIHDYVILVPPKSYSEMEKTVDLIMTYMVEHEEFGDVIFGQNITKTGIATFVAGNDLFVVQNFC